MFKQINKTIVLVTHDVIEAFELCDRLCLLNKGEIQQIGLPKELLFNPANEFVDSFFSSDRFQLELLSVRLVDVLKSGDDNIELYWSPPSKEEKKNDSVEPTQSLYQILEEMEQRQHDNVTIIQRVGGQVIDSLSFSDLLDRLQHYKRQLKQRGANG